MSGLLARLKFRNRLTVPLEGTVDAKLADSLFADEAKDGERRGQQNTFHRIARHEFCDRRKKSHHVSPISPSASNVSDVPALAPPTRKSVDSRRTRPNHST